MLFDGGFLMLLKMLEGDAVGKEAVEEFLNTNGDQIIPRTAECDSTVFELCLMDSYFQIFPIFPLGGEDEGLLTLSLYEVWSTRAGRRLLELRLKSAVNKWNQDQSRGKALNLVD